MSEIGEVFKIIKEEGKKKRASNLASSTQILIDNGINFESKNHGVHLVVKHNDKIADFWPSTGKFTIRGEVGYHRGIKNLLNKLGQANG